MYKTTSTGDTGDTPGNSWEEISTGVDDIRLYKVDIRKKTKLSSNFNMNST